MTGIAGRHSVFVLVMGWSVGAVLSQDDMSYSMCPDAEGAYYTTSPDCLIYYQCEDNKVWTRVCFPWQRFDVHQMMCRDLTEVDCNPEYTGIWRRTYDQPEESGGYTIGDTSTQDKGMGEGGSGGYTIGETSTQDKGMGEGGSGGYTIGDTSTQDKGMGGGSGGYTIGETSTQDKGIGEGGSGEYTIGETSTQDKGMGEGGSGGYTIGETSTQDKGMGEGGSGGYTIGNTTFNDQSKEEEDAFTIVGLIRSLASAQNQFTEKQLRLLKIEEIKEYNVLLEEEMIPSGRALHVAKRFVPDDPLRVNETSASKRDKSQNNFKNILLMNVDDQSLNSILNWFASNQMMNVNNRDTDRQPQTSAPGGTLALNMNCVRPVHVTPTPQNTIVESASVPAAIENSTPASSNVEDSSGGFWYWCGAGRFVYTQSNTEGDRLCDQLQDPQFIDQEGSTQQGGDWAGHTFIG